MMYVPTEIEFKRFSREIMAWAYAKFCFAGASHEAVGRRPLTEQQQKIYNLARVGWDAASIAGRTGLPVASVYDGLHKIEFNGWKI
ncbi:MAG: hypothetical protein OEQ39_04170 [Gammaproteobacteria bacterium]|nr:hypothetical protein [Gammaproteobacteria bacterium]MDH3466192.1 hypothetical protein [Gammaproteobacteria bacterium]